MIVAEKAILWTTSSVPQGSVIGPMRWEHLLRQRAKDILTSGALDLTDRQLTLLKK